MIGILIVTHQELAEAFAERLGPDREKAGGHRGRFPGPHAPRRFPVSKSSAACPR